MRLTISGPWRPGGDLVSFFLSRKKSKVYRETKPENLNTLFWPTAARRFVSLQRKIVYFLSGNGFVNRESIMALQTFTVGFKRKWDFKSDDKDAIMSIPSRPTHCGKEKTLNCSLGAISHLPLTFIFDVLSEKNKKEIETSPRLESYPR